MQLARLYSALVHRQILPEYRTQIVELLMQSIKKQKLTALVPILLSICTDKRFDEAKILIS